VWHGPGGGWGGGRRGIKAPTEEERARVVDPLAVGEVSAQTQRWSVRHRRGGGRAGGAGPWVMGEMIVARVRV
jgi:hypothetical protein